MVYLSYPIEKERMNPEKKSGGEKLKWEEGAKGGRGKEGQKRYVMLGCKGQI